MKPLLFVCAGAALAAWPLGAAAAVPDPDRESATPTGWHWWLDQTEAQLNAFRANGERIIELERSPAAPDRFDAVLVANSGVYQRVDGWWYGFTADQVKAKVAEKNGRITDLEPYTVNGERRFAFTLIRNEGDAAKGWWWNYDLTPDQVTADINAHAIRLIDLRAYVVGRQTLYAYVGIQNAGVDAKAWWWYVNVPFQFVVDRLNENGARLVSVDVHDNGNLSVVMVKNDVTYWWWGAGATLDQVSQTLATTASRLVSLKSYLVNGTRLFAFATIDNANDETRRLRSLIGQAFSDPQFGQNIVRGFLVKEVGGPTLASLAADLRFQPLSTLKLLPYLYAMIEIDKGNADLNGSNISWTEATVDDPNTPIDETKYASCLTPGAPNTRTGMAPFADALPTMMWESHNRTLDAFLSGYGPDKITQRAHDLGLTQTEMHYGCPQGADTAPWAANRTTLYDLAALFEGVEHLQFIAKASTREAFFNNMINLNYTGASYTSPITGHTTGPLYNAFLRDLVQREAGPAKKAIVEEFLKQVVLRGKGGSGGPSSTEFGYSDFLHVTLPFKVNGQIVPKTFLVGWFIYGLTTPPGCPESSDKDGGACQALWQPQWDALNTFRSEIHTLPIRLALSTWTVTPPQFHAITHAKGNLTISWSALTGQSYQVQYKSDLAAPAWTPLGGDVKASDSTASKVDSTLGNVRQRFYRVVLLQ